MRQLSPGASGIGPDLGSGQRPVRARNAWDQARIWAIVKSGKWIRCRIVRAARPVIGRYSSRPVGRGRRWSRRFPQPSRSNPGIPRLVQTCSQATWRSARMRVGPGKNAVHGEWNAAPGRVPLPGAPKAAPSASRHAADHGCHCVRRDERAAKFRPEPREWARKSSPATFRDGCDIRQPTGGFPEWSSEQDPASCVRLAPARAIEPAKIRRGARGCPNEGRS